MFDKSILPEGLNITEEDLANTPPNVLKLSLYLIEKVARQEKRIEELEAKLGMDSSNSNKPPSSDSPYKENELKGGKPKKRSKGRKGHRQKFMSPTETRKIQPSPCSCGCSRFKNLEPYYTHQHIELPEIVMTVIHFILYQGKCTACGKVSKGYVPREYATGFGARFSALVAELDGIDANSREIIQTFCSSVLKIHISKGAIQQILDRASKAIKPHYETIRDKARTQDVNHLDETTWKKSGKLYWLWVMANTTIAFFMIHANRSQAAFEELIGAWQGVTSNNKTSQKQQKKSSHIRRKAHYPLSVKIKVNFHLQFKDSF